MRLSGQRLLPGSSILVTGTPVGVLPGTYGVIIVLYLPGPEHVMVHAYALGTEVTRPGRVVGTVYVDHTPTIIMAEV